MIIGSLFLISMSNLSSVSSSEISIAHAENVANAAAQSGLEYGIYQRQNAASPGTAVDGGTAALSAGITATPCTVTYRSVPGTSAGTDFTVSSLAVCYGGTPQQTIRWLSQKVRVTNVLANSYQVDPGSWTNVPYLFAPAFGAAAGGTVVTITGIGFTGATAATFGGNAGTAFTPTSDTSITVTTPAFVGTVPQRVNVTITTPGGTITFPNAFTYQ
ncbi:MAG: IPT/TIG domain-containing protein [Sulfuricella sp.]|nr:IPT/TIG domain-containing protein [Sulfuricella sp.]